MILNNFNNIARQNPAKSCKIRNPRATKIRRFPLPTRQMMRTVNDLSENRHAG
jgi:hypothetical protein